MKELSIEQKAQRYDEVIERAKKLQETCDSTAVVGWCEYLFHELKESEDEKVRKALLRFHASTIDIDGIQGKEILAWLEKQGKETSWKPSKEEMDVLYGLAYITNQYDEHKEEVITRLYQDLKREFFNGSSYENMFPNTSTEDDVRRRSTIQVLEYARTLDTYNQYGKADIDKNIAWLEKQGYTKKDVDDAYLKGICNTKHELEKQDEKLQGKTHTFEGKLVLEAINKIGEEKSADTCDSSIINGKEFPAGEKRDFGYFEEKSADTVEPKFKVGDWITDGQFTCKVLGITGKSYELHLHNDDYCHFGTDVQSVDKYYHLWTIKDAKPGDVLTSIGFHCNCTFIFKGLDSWKFDEPNGDRAVATGYCCLSASSDKMEFGMQGSDYVEVNTIKPATKIQRDLLFQKMKEAGYEWDAEKKGVKKIEDEEYNGDDYGIDGLYHAQRILEKTLGSVDGYQTDDGILSHQCAITAVKKLYEQKPAEWSEEDEQIKEDILYDLNTLLEDSKSEWAIKDLKKEINWIKSLKPHNTLNLSDEQIETLGMATDICSIPEKYYTELNKLYHDLKKLKE